MTDNNKTASVSLGTTPITLFLVFFILKVTGTPGVTDWSWWAVTAPLWVPACAFFLILGLFAIIAGIVAATKR